VWYNQVRTSDHKGALHGRAPILMQQPQVSHTSVRNAWALTHTPGSGGKVNYGAHCVDHVTDFNGLACRTPCFCVFLSWCALLSGAEGFYQSARCLQLALPKQCANGSQ
jgi:hypothetical protein